MVSKSTLSYPTPCLEMICNFFAELISSALSLKVLKTMASQSSIFFFIKTGSRLSIISNVKSFFSLRSFIPDS